MTDTPVIYWFRNDLRLYDNPALMAAVLQKKPVYLAYILDENLFGETNLGFTRMGPVREQFLMDELKAFSDELSVLGHTLHVHRGKPVDVLMQIAKTLSSTQLFAQKEYASEELQQETSLTTALDAIFVYGNSIYPSDQLPFPSEESPYYYTWFKKKVWPLSHHNPIKEPQFSSIHKNALTTTPLPEKTTAPSSKEIKLLATNYLTQHLEHYSETRDLFEGSHYSTLLSPWLANGRLSVAWLFQQLKALNPTNESQASSVQKLMEQLIWKEYYRNLFLRYGNKLFTRHGIRNKNRERYDDLEAFDKWCNGMTDEPLINAFMNELRMTGFCSNRGRMLSAYYLAKELQVNWLWGAMWFEHCLIDYDVCNNYGNWAYQAGVGTDSRFNRRFNLAGQVKKFDPKETFIKRWTQAQLFDSAPTSTYWKKH